MVAPHKCFNIWCMLATGGKPYTSKTKSPNLFYTIHTILAVCLKISCFFLNLFSLNCFLSSKLPLQFFHTTFDCVLWVLLQFLFILWEDTSLLTRASPIWRSPTPSHRPMAPRKGVVERGNYGNDEKEFHLVFIL